MPAKTRLRSLPLAEEIRRIHLLPCFFDGERAEKAAFHGEVYEARPGGPWRVEAVCRERGWSVPPRRILELCCGTGEFLKALALSETDAFCLGVDWAEPVAERAAKRLHEAGVANAAVYRGRMEDALAVDWAEERFDGIFVNFPDPWPKARHHKRRVVRPDTVASLAKALRPGGLLVTATDVKDLHEWHLETLGGSPLFEDVNASDRLALPHPAYAVGSTYQRKGFQAERTVRYTVHRPKS